METKFPYEDLTITLVDVGGQRSERRKWLGCFDSVDAIFFFVALNECTKPNLPPSCTRCPGVVI